MPPTQEHLGALILCRSVHTTYYCCPINLCQVCFSFHQPSDYVDKGSEGGFSDCNTGVYLWAEKKPAPSMAQA